MKALFSALLILTTTLIYGGSDSTINCEKPVIDNVKKIVLADEATYSLQLKGAATVMFTVDENNKVHIESIQSSDFVTAFHVKHALEGKVICLNNMSSGTTYTIVIEFNDKTQVNLF
ncbi:MAG: hypothetical protein H7Y00_09025 [Fimbriimonadaceae bacterium]|nr:hypothetical protein [Chitinophagales bacterium]